MRRRLGKKPRRTLVRIGELVAEAREAPDSPDLHPLDYDGNIIIERSKRGQITIVDGYHRASGLVGWAIAEDALDTKIEVVDTAGVDDDLIAAAAVPEGWDGLSQSDALQTILDRALPRRGSV